MNVDYHKLSYSEMKEYGFEPTYDDRAGTHVWRWKGMRRGGKRCPVVLFDIWSDVPLANHQKEDFAMDKIL